MKLPLNCEAEYLCDFLPIEKANELFIELSAIVNSATYVPQTEDGKTFEVDFGKVMFLDQKLLDDNSFPEEHWGPTRFWTNRLSSLKDKIESYTDHKFEVCVLIYYPDGNSGVGFHSDYSAFGDTTIIPSISLGEEREFEFREKESGLVFSQILENGSLVVMGKHCQNRYEHSLPVNSKYKNPRINLTFRKYGFK